MRKLLVAGLLACVSMPASALEYVRYQFGGQGTAQVYDGSDLSFIPMTFAMTAIVPLDSPSGFVDYEVNGGSYIMRLQFSPYTTVSLNYDHDLAGAPLGTDGLWEAQVSEGIYPGGIFQGASKTLHITRFSQDDPVPYENFLNLSLRAPVPEPASWAMMIGGFALVGAGQRRRASRVSFG